MPIIMLKTVVFSNTFYSLTTNYCLPFTNHYSLVTGYWLLIPVH